MVAEEAWVKYYPTSPSLGLENHRTFLSLLLKATTLSWRNCFYKSSVEMVLFLNGGNCCIDFVSGDFKKKMDADSGYGESGFSDNLCSDWN